MHRRAAALPSSRRPATPISARAGSCRRRAIRLAGRRFGRSRCLAGSSSVDDAIAVFDAGSETVRILSMPCRDAARCRGCTPWSPDGTALAVAGCNPCNNSERQRTHRPPSSISTCSSCQPTARRCATSSISLGRRSDSPSWSPDGSHHRDRARRLPRPASSLRIASGRPSMQTVDVDNGAAHPSLAATSLERRAALPGPLMVEPDRIHRPGRRLRDRSRWQRTWSGLTDGSRRPLVT